MQDSDAQRARRRFLREAVFSGVSVAMLIRAALAAEGRGSGMAEVKGEVLVNGRPVRSGDAVGPGDRVVTAAGAFAVFTIGRDAFLLRERSDVRTSGASVLADPLRLVTGKLLSVFGRGRHNIVTTAATIGIRGTGIYLEAEAERTYVCTCYGMADLQASNMPEARETVQTTHHESPRYIYAQGEMPIKMIEAAPVINHTDAELIMLEALVGRKPPFVDTGTPYPRYF